MYTVGVLTVSDSAFADNATDRSGPALGELLATKVPAWIVAATKVVPDEVTAIQTIICDWVDSRKLDLVLTTGGTGFGVRDVTPEAVGPLLERNASGLVVAMLTSSLKITPFAALSRPVAGTRGKTLIMTLPGSPKGATENLDAVLSVLSHAVELARGGSGRKKHTEMAETQRKETKSMDLVKERSLEGRSSGHRCSHHDHVRVGDGESEKLSNNLNGPVALRSRISPYPLTPMEEALKVVANHARRLSCQTVPVDENLIGSVLAEDVIARESVPGYRASIMDGYAVIASDGPGVYPVAPPTTAGCTVEPPHLQRNHVARITTGAPLPPGATAVVMVEDTVLVKSSEDGSVEELVEIKTSVRKGENVREVGVDTAIGELVLRNGELITAVGGEISVLCSVGVRQVAAFRRPVVAILSSGNEVVDASDPRPLKYGQIRDSNRPTLKATISKSGFEVIDLGIVEDTPGSVEKAVRAGLERADVLVTTGGVSMGELDLLKSILERSLNGKIHFGRVDMKPGKPTTFATVKGFGDDPESEKLIFALPGNPVSAVVTYYLFVLPALRRMAGYSRPDSPVVKARIAHDISLDSRPEYYRATLSIDPVTSSFVAHGTGVQQSSRMLSVRAANSILKLPRRRPDCIVLPAGTIVDAILIGEL